MHPLTRNRLRPALETLEAREVPTGWLSSNWAAFVGPVPAPAPSVPAVVPVGTVAATAVTPPIVSPIGTAMASYLQAHLGQRVGGGECAQLAVEALRASGARFVWVTSATPDYAWGTGLTTILGTAAGGVYRRPAAFQPGDVIQFTNARFRDGTWDPHHTAIVASVDSAGRVTSVYQQNFNEVRLVTQQPLDLTQLISGYVKVYRPQRRTAVAGCFRFTVVNNTGAAVGVVERAGTGVSAYALSKAGTAPSYQVRWWSTYGGVTPAITVAGHSITVTDGAAYEIYNSGTGIAIRRIG